MRHRVLTNCTVMPMSEHFHRISSHASGSATAATPALMHAGEVAQWSLVLLGWLWLGEQGMRWGWSLASGVLPVALWWAARLVSRGRTWALQASPLGMGLLGVFTACGVYWTGLLSTPDAAHASLMVVAVLWGLWCAVVESRSPSSTFTMGPVAWHPVVAAALVYVVWRNSAPSPWDTWQTSAALTCCVAVLWARDRRLRCGAAICRGVLASRLHVLPASAMGLMMGSLWQGTAWCAGLNGSLSDMVTAHLALMAVLPAVVTVFERTVPMVGDLSRSSHAGTLGLGCLVLGPCMFWGDTAMHGALAMLLPSLAWALHTGRHRTPWAHRVRWSPQTMRGLSLLLGPGLLVWVGWMSPGLGPLAVQWALTLLGLLAAIQLMHSLWSASGSRLNRLPRPFRSPDPGHL